MINELIKLATHLDKRGHYREANYLDVVIRKFAAGPCPTDRVRIKINFDKNKWKVDDAQYNVKDAHCLVESGMLHDRKFMTVKGGTSGTGTTKVNEEVMHKRINEALRHLYDSYSDLGVHKLSYSYDEFKNMADIDLNFNTIRPGSTLPTKEEAPKDANHEYYKGHQYVQIIIGPIADAPNFGKLANDFLAATVEMVGTDDDVVFEILSQLRDYEDFRDFNKALVKSHGKTFYGVACDKVVGSKPGTMAAWLSGKAGYPGGLGPAEIGDDDMGVAGQLQRLGAEPIKC